jgi:ribosomal protein L37AE/L43A
MIERFGYTGEEKARIRLGFQCPECFGAATEQRSGTAFQCRDCEAQWHAADTQFQNHNRTTEK